jgi:glycosyltransferase involved in cell wall biosynthesis
MTTTHRPKVTVFIPVYNRADYIGAAIDSILAQSFTDFELLLVDDGSTDRSLEVIKSYQDPRVRVACNAANLGIPRTRNRGLALARGEYIALLDSDDRAYPQRLAKQVEVLDRHPDYVQVGTWCRMMDAQGQPLKKSKRQPILPQDVDAQLLFRCALSNRSIMARTEILRQYGYRNDYPRCQDYDLHVRLAREHKMANLPECLVYGRVHPQQITAQTTELGDDRKREIVRSQLVELGASFTEADLIPHLNLSRLRKLGLTPDRAYLEWAEHWLLGLRQANQRTRRYAQKAFDRALSEKWMQACGAVRRELGWDVVRIFLRSPLRGSAGASLRQHVFARARGRELLGSV